MIHSRRRLLCCAATIVAAATPLQVGAAAKEQSFDIPRQELKYSLRDLAKQVGLELAAKSDDLNGKQAATLHGHYSVEHALQKLLTGSGLSAQIHDGAIFIRGRSLGSSEPTESSEADQTISVTGSRIRGASVTSPTTTITAQDMKAAGQNNLGEAVRSLPQNFSGGQNPGVTPGAVGAFNQNINSGSSINLRGLGPDATLTLLNGHRLAYGSFVQAIDINAIPLEAVERIEIVADGASAIYGSDAVGGVANIILKRDYQGLTASARFGAATEGGYQQQQYSVVGGMRWASGGVVATYSHEHDTALRARQRDYLTYMPGDSTLIPSLNQNSALVSGHQTLAPGLVFNVDALFSQRSTGSALIIPATIRYDITPSDKSWAISPSLRYDVSPGLSLSLTGTYGKDRTRFIQTSTSPTGAVSYLRSCYCSTLKSVEGIAEGSVIDLPAGSLRFAAGAGYRDNVYYSASNNSAAVIDATRASYYGFGELYAPIASAAQGRRGLYKLAATAAVRYENYPGITDVATPKIGLIYAPSADIELKGSWGRSFKAPTLAQQYQSNFLYLYKASALGGIGYPATATALLLTGGNATLKPEKAETWTGTITLHPRSLPGASIDLSYFHLRYRNRVTQPIQGTNFTSSLSDSRYANFITANPSSAAQASLIAQAINGLSNLGGGTYNQSNVVAFIRDSYLNAATQHYEGIDVSARYHLSLAAKDSLDLSAAGSWLRSDEQLDAAVPLRDLAGTIFNSPHYRARGGAVLKVDRIEASAFGNFTGGETDNRTSPFVHVGSQTTADLSLRWTTPPMDHRLKFEFALSVQNVLDAHPSYAKPAANYYVAYDSTNQTAIGRFISFAISSHW